ncbi:unnamed protein product [Effrenium voratum]|uniref:Uncharacterized protein n=1 Tax=Effrenium voratum TaxID=2562239 RepID=A0AA36NAL9_9DINO|nr:unnamed protein product [Effrenium voratum]CAJ1439164.1 unnamed protein product [Effrenium voratum]
MASECHASSLEVSEYSVTVGAEDWVEKAYAIFQQQGFCIALDALGEESAEVLQTCEATLEGEGEPNAEDATGRSHFPWQLLQSPVLALLQRLAPDFAFCAARVEAARPGAKCQELRCMPLSQLPTVFRDPEGAPKVAVAFTLQGLEPNFAPLRVAPKRRAVCRADLPPRLKEEPQELWQSTLSPLPKGAAIIRDLRLWCGEAANLTQETRFLPCLELVSLDYASFIAQPHSFSVSAPCDACQWDRCCIQEPRRCLPDSIFETLPEDVQKHCRVIRGELSSAQALEEPAPVEEGPPQKVPDAKTEPAEMPAWQDPRPTATPPALDGFALKAALAKTVRVTLGLALLAQAVRLFSAGCTQLEQLLWRQARAVVAKMRR